MDTPNEIEPPVRVVVAESLTLGVDVPEADYAQVDTLEHMADYFKARL